MYLLFTLTYNYNYVSTTTRCLIGMVAFVADDDAVCICAHLVVVGRSFWHIIVNFYDFLQMPLSSFVGRNSHK